MEYIIYVTSRPFSQTEQLTDGPEGHSKVTLPITSLDNLETVPAVQDNRDACRPQKNIFVTIVILIKESTKFIT